CEVRTRQVCSYRTVCEQVPCVTYVNRQVCQRVPVTVCKKVPYSVTECVPTTVTRMVRESHLEQVPCTTTRLSIQWVRTQVPYTVTRVVRGCYCDSGDCGGAKPGPNGIISGSPSANAATGYDTEGPGRVFVEGGMCSRTVQQQTVRMV